MRGVVPLANLTIPLMMIEKDTRSQPRTIKLAVVDDDASVRNGISRLARSHGFVCTTFDSGESALSESALDGVDCVILDIQLGGIDGFETRDLLAARGLRLPVIFITAHLEANSPEWQRHLKGSTCLSKPFEATDLISAIYRTVEL
jgi:FixJ family two-component response regulator